MVKVWVHYSYYGNAYKDTVESFSSLQDFSGWLFGNGTLHNVSIYGRRNGRKSHFDETYKEDMLDVPDGRDDDWWIQTSHWSHGYIGALSMTRVSRIDVDGKCYLNNAHGVKTVTNSGYEKIIKPLIAELKEIRGLNDDAVVYAD